MDGWIRKREKEAVVIQRNKKCARNNNNPSTVETLFRRKTAE